MEIFILYTQKEKEKPITELQKEAQETNCNFVLEGFAN